MKKFLFFTLFGVTFVRFIQFSLLVEILTFDIKPVPSVLNEKK